MELKVKVDHVTVVQQSGGTDIILITCVGPTSFPELDKEQPGAYPPSFRIEARKGYAGEWLTAMGFDLKTVKFVKSS